MLRFSLLATWLLSLLPTIVWAVTADRLTPTTPEQYYERALELSERVGQRTDALVALESRGEFENVEPDQLLALKDDTQAVLDNLNKAAQGGHVLAIYWLSNTKTTIFMPEAEKVVHCETLHKAVDQGLLAAAVAYFHQCGRPHQPADYLSPAHLQTVATLKQLLAKGDVHKGAYPLRASLNYCFRDVAGEIAEEKTLANLQARQVKSMLTYEQYRTEAYYILAATDRNEEGLPDSHNLAYLNQALAMGCNDVMSLKYDYEKMFGPKTPK